MHRCDAQGASHLSHRGPRDMALPPLRMTPDFDHLVLGFLDSYYEIELSRDHAFQF